MFVFSKNIIEFIKEIKFKIKQILSKEMSFDVRADRFFIPWKQASYPISVMIHNDKEMLGFFDPDFYNLGFHQCLMRGSREQLHNIIRHELAHYMIFIKYGGEAQVHGAEFREYCRLLGWGEEVYKATTVLDTDKTILSDEDSSVLRRIQKLMALSTSSNQNEAEQAMIKSQQLLLKHNVDARYMEDDEKVFLKRIMKQKKASAKMEAIANVLKTFFVSPVYSRANGFVYLEIIGDAINIEIAEYVASILDDEFDKLWDQTRKQQPNLKGMVAKNSFFKGIARGYCNKVSALKKEYDCDVKNALIIIEKKLIDAQSLVYKKLSTSSSHASHCEKSSALGEKAGNQLNINPAVTRAGRQSDCLLIKK